MINYEIMIVGLLFCRLGDPSSFWWIVVRLVPGVITALHVRAVALNWGRILSIKLNLFLNTFE